MSIQKRAKVGNVDFVVLSDNTEETYSDGDIEHKLLELYKQKSPDEAAFRKKHPGWSTDYHLLSTRKNLLNWYQFKPGARILEIGAGCGAITGLLCERAKEVTALELSYTRASINAHRHKDKKNLEVVVGNLENLNKYTLDKYDYVVCIGVLEYAGRFINSEEPFHSFAKELRTFTKQGGALILAIENKLGIKYLSGAKEDHVRRYMEGIEDYPHYDGVRTFGKQELKSLIEDCGYKKTDFYFPFPDYKMPQTVYSEGYLPGINTENIPYGLFPTPNPDQSRQQVFREQLALRSVAKNGLLGELANSFLVVASATENTDKQAVFARGSTGRKNDFGISTSIHSSGKKLYVQKQSLSKQSNGHIHKLEKTYGLLKDCFGKEVAVCKPQKESDNAVSFPYIVGPTFETVLVNNLLAKEYRAFNNTIDQFVSLITSLEVTPADPTINKDYTSIFGSTYSKKTSLIYPGIIDMNFDNIVSDKKTGRYTLIDYEWCFDFPVPKDYVIGRALLYFFMQHSQLLRGIASPDNPLVELGKDLYVPEEIASHIQQYLSQAAEIFATEKCFQHYVNIEAQNFELYSNSKTIDQELPDNTPESYESSLSVIKSYKQAIEEQHQQIEQLTKQLNYIRNSKLWYVGSKLKSILKKLRLR